jgi:WD40 repeat protein
MQRWTVGSGAERRRRLLWRADPVGDGFSDVACTRLPDGTAVAVSTYQDGSLQLWDLATGTPRGPAFGGTGQEGTGRAVVCTELAAGTPVAVTRGGDGVLAGWDLLTCELLSEAPVDTERARALSCTRLADGTAIAVTGGGDDAIRFWDVATGRQWGPPVECEPPRLPLAACTHLADGTAVAVIVEGGSSLRVWDLAAGAFRGEPMTTDFEVAAVACLRLGDGTPLAVVGGRGEGSVVQVWDLASGRPFGGQWTEPGDGIWALATTLLPDGSPIVIAADYWGDARVRAWNLATGRAHGHALPKFVDTPALGCAELPDGTPVLVAADAELQAWSLVVAPSTPGLTGPLWTLGSVELPDGDEVVVTAGDSVRLWQADTGSPRGELDVAGAVACTRLPNGAPVVLAPHESGTRLWDLVSGDSRDVALDGPVLDCVTRHDGTPIVVTGPPVRAWDLAAGAPFGPPLPVDPYWDRGLSCLPLPDGTVLAVLLDDEENLRTWDLRSGQPFGPQLTSAAEVMEIDTVATMLLADGTPIALYVSPFTLHVWDLAAGRPHGKPLDLDTTTSPVALACTRLPDGTALAAVGGLGKPEQDGVVEIWDLDRRAVRHVFGVPEPVLGLDFTARHRLIVRSYLDIAVHDLL